MSRLTTVVVARDEERNISRCVQSALPLGNVIVADTGSSDRTSDIAQEAGAEVHTLEWQGFGKTKQAACRLAESEYILSLDADEAVSSRLCEHIQEVMANEESHPGYRCGRVTNLCGFWIQNSGWHPEYVTRIFRRNAGSFSDDILHESILVDGSVGDLSGVLLHFSYPSMSAYFAKVRSYSLLGAQKYRESCGKMAVPRLFINPVWGFLRKFVVQRGYADGIAGMWIAVFTMVGQFLKYWFALRRR
jgi:glycosyltransferase involved in cell wall biosynthesis